jgi:GT2 family glycosyltransferase
VISIITAVYNQLTMNQLFVEKLQQYTHHPYELIIIDNGSSDGSAEFFESVGATVIRNEGNYSYPYCQNQGIKVAQYDWLCFLNNDIIVSRDWDKHILENMQANDLEVATVCGVEHLENRKATRKLRRRWNRIKGVISLFGRSRLVLQLMHKLMYPNWEAFTQRRYTQFKSKIKPGFVGNTVVMQRSALAKIGLWDERIQAADFDLYLRSIERAQKVGDIKPVHICLDTFIHHYIRLTAKMSYPPFADRERLIGVGDKWPPEMLEHFKTMND